MDLKLAVLQKHLTADYRQMFARIASYYLCDGDLSALPILPTPSPLE